VGAGLGPRRGDLDPHSRHGDRAVTLRVHQIVADADLDDAIAALGELRAAGRPAPEDPNSDEDTDLDGRGHLADRLSDEVDWLRRCAGWLRQLDGGGHPPAVNLRPSADWPAVVGGLADSAGYRWGGWGSNPRPADYEKYGLVHRAR
jgi:hypothetical protein